MYCGGFILIHMSSGIRFGLNDRPPIYMNVRNAKFEIDQTTKFQKYFVHTRIRSMKEIEIGKLLFLYIACNMTTYYLGLYQKPILMIFIPKIWLSKWERRLEEKGKQIMSFIHFSLLVSLVLVSSQQLAFFFFIHILLANGPMPLVFAAGLYIYHPLFCDNECAVF